MNEQTLRKNWLYGLFSERYILRIDHCDIGVPTMITSTRIFKGVRNWHKLREIGIYYMKHTLNSWVVGR